MKVLIFGTVYAKDEHKLKLAQQWDVMHSALNPNCDLLLVDSASDVRHLDFRRTVLSSFSNNIGHLARGGQDGWGRAFCEGLRFAMSSGHDYVVHIEGDSLCNLDVRMTCKRMAEMNHVAYSVPVKGTPKREAGWIETGLMFLDVNYIRDTKLVERYNWPDGASKKYPNTPEKVLGNILDRVVRMPPWVTTRDDVKALTLANVMNYQWISHALPHVSDHFFNEHAAMLADAR